MLDGIAAFQGCVQAGDGSDMGALRDQTALNIREWGGGRKQKPFLNVKTATSERWGWPLS